MKNAGNPMPRRSIQAIAEEAIAHLIPPKTPFAELDSHVYGWKRHHEYIIAGRDTRVPRDLASTIAEHFAETSGKVVLIGEISSLSRTCTSMFFRRAEIPMGPVDSYAIEPEKRAFLNRSMEEIFNLPIDLLDIDRCGDAVHDDQFITDVTSDRPLLIVVDPSTLEDTGEGPFVTLIRRVHLFHMIEELKKTNENWRILWNLPLPLKLSTDWDSVPSVDDLEEKEILERATAIIFPHLQQVDDEPLKSTLVIAKNSGSTGTIDAQYVPALALWENARPNTSA